VRRFLSDLLRIDPSKRLTLRAAHDKHSLFKGGITLYPTSTKAVMGALDRLERQTKEIGITVNNIEDKIDDIVATLAQQSDGYSETLGDALAFFRDELSLDGNIHILGEILAAVQEASGRLDVPLFGSVPGGGGITHSSTVCSTDATVISLIEALQARIDLSLETAVSALSSESRSLAVALQSSVREGMQEMRSTVSSAVANANANAVAVAGAEVAAVAGEAEAGREAALVVQKQLTMLQNQVSQLHG
jgi:hypothetical protein